MGLIITGVLFMGTGAVLVVSQPFIKLAATLIGLGFTLVIGGIRSVRYNRETERILERMRRQ